MEINEFNIPAPWGRIAVKAWGSKTNEAILVTHGLMDNAGSFDNLIPLLPKNYYYICVDFPGHGLSTSFHNSTPIITVDYILVLKIAADYFGRHKYVLMGHSYGGQLSILLAQIYPELVSKLIILDAISYYPTRPDVILDEVEKAIDILLNNQIERKRTVYSYDDAVYKLIAGRSLGKLTRRAAENMANRHLEKIGDDQYIFTIDPRLKQRLTPSGDMRYVLQTHREAPIHCKVLVLLFNETGFDQLFRLICTHFHERNFEMHNIEGHHDYHNTNPESVAEHINEFLTRNNKM